MFVPTFCPYKACSMHFPSDVVDGWYQHDGYHETKAFGDVPRFRCKYCRRSFSEQTFSINYYCKKDVDYDRVIEQLCTAGCLRDISRVLRVRVSTVSNRIYRIARQFVAVLTQLTEHMRLREDLVADGFESFTGSKYFPNNIHLLVGSRSRMLYFFNLVNLRRKGRMTDEQRAVRDLIDQQWRPEPYALEDSFAELVDEALRLWSKAEKQQVTLHTDEKQEYGRVIKRATEGKLVEVGRQFTHTTTSSHEYRGSKNPLAPVNIVDRQLRHAIAAYRRKTIAQTRDNNHGMARLAVYSGYYNWIKPWKVDNFPMKQPSHAQVAGIEQQEIRWRAEGILKWRHFLSHQGQRIRGAWHDLWTVRLETPMKPPSTGAAAYVPRYIFM
jgi:hypothetical protein